MLVFLFINLKSEKSRGKWNQICALFLKWHSQPDNAQFPLLNVFLKIRVFLFIAVIKCKTAFKYRCLWRLRLFRITRKWNRTLYNFKLNKQTWNEKVVNAQFEVKITWRKSWAISFYLMWFLSKRFRCLRLLNTYGSTFLFSPNKRKIIPPDALMCFSLTNSYQMLWIQTGLIV